MSQSTPSSDTPNLTDQAERMADQAMAILELPPGTAMEGFYRQGVFTLCNWSLVVLQTVQKGLSPSDIVAFLRDVPEAIGDLRASEWGDAAVSDAIAYFEQEWAALHSSVHARKWVEALREM